MNLHELTDLVYRRGANPVGFAFSTAIHAELSQLWTHSDHSKTTFMGAPFVVDPGLEPEQFDVAFTEDAWRAILEGSVTLDVPIHKG